MIRILVIYLLLTGVSLVTSAQISTDKKIIVIAHRGDHTRAPENTIQAYQNAITAGVDFVEIDLRSTKDGHLIIMHDESINRMTGGKGKVNELIWKDMRLLKVQDKQHPEWGAHPIPTFDEVLTFCKGKVNVYLDFKSASVDSTWQYIRKEGMEQSVVVYINSELQYKQWRKVAPHLPLIISLPEELDNKMQVLGYLQYTDAEILDGGYLEYTPEKTEAAHKMNRKIWVDIQHPEENPTMWEKALRLQVDGLQTDHPSELINYLKSKGLR